MEFFTRHIPWVIACAFAMLMVGGYFFTVSPPQDFPSGSTVVILRGATAPAIAHTLGNARIIAHPTALRLILRILGASTRVQAGAYFFSKPENLLTVTYRLVTGAYGLPSVRITFPEGETVRDVAARVHEAFPDISESDFFSLAQLYEGYLFPDTYLFSSSVDAASIIQIMFKNFNTRVSSSSPAVAASGHSLSDIVIMASLIEREARTSAVRHMVAGILWNRLQLGMPLQVDAVFGYIFSRDTYSPSLADLKVDSPYNTYTHTGLPPGPIANPGLESIEAALHPTKTDYLYYLVDKNGVIHYATTYAGHQSNRAKYLR
ncbi:MAG: endolytic transglycosylase MltG [Patescibacteria group bacterium]